MQVIKENGVINFVEDNKIHLSMYNLLNTIVCDFYSYDKIIINSKTDESLYNNFKWLMDQSYTFSNELSMKDDNKLVWFSENCYNLKNDFEVNNTPRMIIEREGDNLIIYCKRPFFEKNDIDNMSTVSFNTSGLMCPCKNDSSDAYLQNDICNVLSSSLNNKCIEKENNLKLTL